MTTDPRTLPVAIAELFEDRRRALALAVGVLVFVLLPLFAGCAGPLPMTREADRTQVCFVVQWERSERIPAVCDAGVTRRLPSAACAFVTENRIVTRKPRDWYDTEALVSLGHEVLHILGARHDN